MFLAQLIRSEVAKALEKDCFALIFGFNLFVSYSINSVLTSLFIQGWIISASIRGQTSPEVPGGVIYDATQNFEMDFSNLNSPDFGRVTFIICVFVLLREIRPIESYITSYLVSPPLNFSIDVVSEQIFPFGLLTTFISTIVIFLITDYLRYKPVIILGGIFGVLTYGLLLGQPTLPILLEVAIVRSESFSAVIQRIVYDFKTAYTNPYVLKWCIWWGLSYGIYNLMLTYSQTLWQIVFDEDKGKTKLMNGVVDSIFTLTCAILSYSIGYVKFDWKTNVDLILSVTSFLMAFLAQFMYWNSSLLVLYAVYICVGCLFQTVLTIAYSEVAQNIEKDSYALIFGFNCAVTYGSSYLISGAFIQGWIKLLTTREQGPSNRKMAQLNPPFSDRHGYEAPSYAHPAAFLSLRNRQIPRAPPATTRAHLNSPDFGRVTFIICVFVLLREIRPIESYLTSYLVSPPLNFSIDVVNEQVFPFGLLTTFISTIVIFLITDYLRYKPVIILGGIFGVLSYGLLLSQPTLPILLVEQACDGFFFASTVPSSTYLYAKVGDSDRYMRISALTQSCTFLGSFFRGILSELIVRYCGQVTLVYEVAIVRSESFSAVIKRIVYDFKMAYTNPYVLKWCIWWGLSYGIYNLMLTYSQTLWQIVFDEDKGKTKLMNGVVDSIFTLTCAILSYSIGYVKFDWKTNVDLILSVTSFLMAFLAQFMYWNSSLLVLYAVYICVGCLFQTVLTIAYSEVAQNIEKDSYALIFGFNCAVTYGSSYLISGAFIQGWIKLLTTREQGPSNRKMAQLNPPFSDRHGYEAPSYAHPAAFLSLRNRQIPRAPPATTRAHLNSPDFGRVTFIICVFVLLREIRPIESYLTSYLVSPPLNFSIDVEVAIVRSESFSAVIKRIVYDFKMAYTNPYVLKWCIWWGLSYGIYNLMLTYSQTLWQIVFDEDKGKTKLMNGVVDSIFTLTCAILSYSIGYVKFDWKTNVDLILSVTSFLMAFLVQFMYWNSSLLVLYAVYICVGCLFQTVLTIAYSEVAQNIEKDSYALIFGFNCAVTYGSSYLISGAFIQGWIKLLTTREQFLLYTLYFILLAVFYFFRINWRCRKNLT
ncbi:hypothetical protein V9T40_002002 [Parthenolecanium corni]|uniref:Reduced folate carrier n=1 Tax=Parthenolecanium corni TaxID=536013 RepID=A0AAN9Y3Q1_9HEMI